MAGGGARGPGFTRGAEVYTPATNRWTPAGNLTAARGFHVATLLPSGEVLVAGGFADSGTLRSAELFNPATGRWRRTGSLRNARAHASMTLTGTSVLVAGGPGPGARAGGRCPGAPGRRRSRPGA